MLTEWLAYNEKNNDGRGLTYCEFPMRYTWDEKDRYWKKRELGFKIGRLYFVHPSAGERYYLRMLLMVVKGATSFEDLKTFNGTQHSTFKECCAARGLLGDDNEWINALNEAASWGSGYQLRHLFVTMLLYCEIKDEYTLFETVWPMLGDDIQRSMQRTLNNPNFLLAPYEIKDVIIDDISALLSKRGVTIDDYNLPKKTDRQERYFSNRLIDEELSYDLAKLESESDLLRSQLNAEQLSAFQQIVTSVFAAAPAFYFVSGFGGTGKTFLWNAIISFVRSKRKIVLTVASSGVAALLLPGGRTAHSRFKIPLDIDEGSVCEVKRGSMLAGLILESSLVIWDEALMTHRRCFEALDRSFRDIMAAKNPDAKDILFGGKVVVLGGDLRQILPVIEGGSKAEIINASIIKSSLWHHVKILKLTINMRLSCPNMDPVLQEQIATFSKWVLDLGEGNLPTESCNGDDESALVEIPKELLIHNDDNKISSIASSVYTDFLHNFSDPSYLRKRAILTPTNEGADEINLHMLSLVPGEEREYLSCDTISKSSDTTADADLLYPTEFLNSLKFNNFPQHRLILKRGAPVMLLRNLSQYEGLCNGTRLIITNLASTVIEAMIITGTGVGNIVYIPRIVIAAQKTKLPFILQRRQFPLKLSYGMTINKSQGQTLDRVGVYLKQPVFTHGQLYVAVSRVTSKEGLTILIENDDSTCGSKTKNIVYKEILSSIT